MGLVCVLKGMPDIPHSIKFEPDGHAGVKERIEAANVDTSPMVVVKLDNSLLVILQRF